MPELPRGHGRDGVPGASPATMRAIAEVPGSEEAAVAPSQLRRVLIVAPHFPPSNLAAVHRSRLFALHLREFGWEPIIITVHHEHYEEALDWNLAALVPDWVRVERVGALPTRPVRLVGDIGIRGFAPLLRRIVRIARRDSADFLYVTVPSFYGALLGRAAHALCGIPYGIDYIDPWVQPWPEGAGRLSKAWLSQKLARLLEPAAVRHASLVTGVAEGYYRDVLVRHQHLRGRAVTAAMPYGGEASDHEQMRALGLQPTLFQREPGVYRFVYAGAMLPRAYAPLEAIFRAIAADRARFADVRFQFIGTGKSPNDPNGHNVKPLAERYGLWGTIVHEHPARMPYLDVLAHLEAADGVFILGSTEPHYTPSKTYQGVLSGKPIFAVLHQASTACAVLRETGAGQVIAFDGEAGVPRIEATFVEEFERYRAFSAEFDPARVDRDAFEAYSARSVTRMLAGALDEATARARRS